MMLSSAASRCALSKSRGAVALVVVRGVSTQPKDTPHTQHRDSVVTRENYKTATPHRESTKVTLMPWRGWFDRWIASTFGEERYQQLRKTFFYSPDDDYDLLQIPFPHMKVKISEDDPEMTAEFRSTSPGSQDPVNIPRYDRDPYDTGYFKRDTRRRYINAEFANPETERIKLGLMEATADDPDDPSIHAAKEKIESGPTFSPGNKGNFATGPTDFDPTGLRATMSATYSELQKSLDENMPDHMLSPVWFDKQDEVVAWYEENDLPVPAGGTGFGLVASQRRVASWNEDQWLKAPL